MRYFLALVLIVCSFYSSDCKGLKKLCPEFVFNYTYNNQTKVINGYYESEYFQGNSDFEKKVKSFDEIVSKYIVGDNQAEILKIVSEYEKNTLPFLRQNRYDRNNEETDDLIMNIKKIQKNLIDYQDKVTRKNHFRYSQLLFRVNNTLDFISILYNQNEKLLDEDLISTKDFYDLLFSVYVRLRRKKNVELSLGFWRMDEDRNAKDYYNKQLILSDRLTRLIDTFKYR